MMDESFDQSLTNILQKEPTVTTFKYVKEYLD